MSWGIRIFAAIILAVLLGLLFKPPRHLPPSASPESPPIASSPAVVVPTVASLNATAPVRVTVYQDAAGGQPSFSDRMDRGQPHVIDHSKGNTYQSIYRGEVPNTASLTYTPSTASLDPVANLRQDNARFQQQVQEAKQQRVQQAIGE